MLKREEYLFTVKRPYPPFFAEMIFRGLSKEENYVGLIKNRFSLTHELILRGDVYYAKKEVDHIAELAFKALMDESFFPKVVKELEDRAELLLEAAEGDDLDRFKVAYERYAPSLFIPWAPEGLIVSRVRELLSEKTPEDVDEVIGVINIPVEDNYYKKEEEELVVTENIKEHVKKYEWLIARYGIDNPYTVEQAEEKKKNIDAETFLKERRKEKEKVKEVLVKVKKILGRDSHVIDVMQWAVYYRTQRTDVINRAQYVFMPAVRELAAKLGLSYEQLLYVMPFEMEEELPSMETIKERMKSHTSVMADKKVWCASGNEDEEIFKLLQEDVSGVNSVTGTVACKGGLKGTVRIIESSADLDKVGEGDILVTSMTTPNMMAAMKKAAAFVTDEGGITCHAAIVSRELKKPCVIGTKVATKVFKDGDMVEVNANKGVVKKI